MTGLREAFGGPRRTPGTEQPLLASGPSGTARVRGARLHETAQRALVAFMRTAVGTPIKIVR